MSESTRGDVRPGALRAGELAFGRYRVEGLIAHGSTGDVYRATRAPHGQPVALKVPLPELGAVPAFADRFVGEARAAMDLDGDHVVRVLDVGRGANGPYVVMELLDGRDLDAILDAEGPLPVALAVDHTIAVCEGLATVRGLGLEERELEPSDVFLLDRPEDGVRVKLMRLGGRDERSDVRGAAAILYELVTGAAPLGPAPTSPSVLAEEIPPALDALLVACLWPDAGVDALPCADVAAFAAAVAPFGSNDAAARAADVARALDASRRRSSGQDDVLPVSAPSSCVRRRETPSPVPSQAAASVAATRRSLSWAAWAVLVLALATASAVLGSRPEPRPPAPAHAPEVP